MSAPPDLAAYWQESASWEVDRTRQWRETALVWRWVAAGGWSCAIAAAAALVVLMPLKQVQPFVIRVDNSTGIVDVVPEYAGRGAAPQIMTRYLLTHYVGICERFNFATAESDYQECGAFNSAQRNQLWYAQWKRANPASPLNLYKDGTTLRAQVTSVSFLEGAGGPKGLAQVRYLKRARPSADAAEQITHWIATLQYIYSAPSRDPQQRSLNPMGLRITDFHTEQEALPENAAAGPATAAAPQKDLQ